MRIDRILHPEIVLGKRGDKRLIQFYKTCFPQIELTPEGYACGLEVRQFDENLRDHAILTHKFRQSGSKVFYCGKDFIQVLSKIDKEIPLQFMPQKFLGYLAFPEETVFDGEEEIQGAYVYVGEGKGTTLKKEDWDKKIIWISYVGKNLNSITRLCAELTEDKMSEISTRYEMADYNVSEVIKGSVPGSRELVYRLVANLVLYINSADPDLIGLKTMHLESKTQRNKAEARGEIINECTLPITLLSWNYKREINYSKESTWVETHPRWQRCGSGFTQIKLIWVKAHERHLLKE
jgi:hypothetical protein